MAAKKKKPTTVRARNMRAPTIIARSYRDHLLRLVADMRPAINAAVKRFNKEVAAEKARTDSLDLTPRLAVTIGNFRVDAATAVRRSLAGVAIELDTIVKKARPNLIAQGIGKRTSAYARETVDKSVRGIVSIDVAQTSDEQDINRFVRDNVALIKSIPKQLHADVQDELTEAWSVGRDPAVLAVRIEERFGVAANRARLIARDQVATMNGRIVGKRQKDLGIKRYEWNTSLDERVRGDPSGLYPDAKPSHYDREGKIFSWDDPPEDGHPGIPINCRCTAVAIIDIDDEEA